MNPSILFYLSSSESDEAAFRTRYRLTKNYVLCHLNFIRHLSTAVPPKVQLAATLSHLASGSFQYSVGNDYLVMLGQSTVCKIVKHVINEMETYLCLCIDHFFKKYKIPTVVGCVDGTHIGLQRPSINICSLKEKDITVSMLRFTIMNRKYGGAAHDLFVWWHSAEKILLEELYNKNLKNAWLLGDSEPWLITPYRNPEGGSMEAYFNDIHSKARCIIETSISILKARRKILSNEKRSRYNPEKIAQ